MARLTVVTGLRLTGNTRSSWVGCCVPAPDLRPFLFRTCLERPERDLLDGAMDNTQTNYVHLHS